MSFSFENFNLYLGPKEQGGPDSLIKVIIDFINIAKKKQKLMIAVQEIDNKKIVEAIVEAKKRGVTVKIILEQDYLLSHKTSKTPFEPKGKNEQNRYLLNAMLRANIDIKFDFNTKIFHQKFMILDDLVLTGSTNFTDTGVRKNLNHIVVIKNNLIARAYKEEFKEMQKGLFGKYSVKRTITPKEIMVSNIRIKPLFAPDHSPEMEIMKQILKAKKKIDFAIFTFSNSSGIDDALIAAKEKGIKINGIMDKKQSNHKWAAKKNLINSDINITLVGGNKGLGKLHHKLMVIDDSIAIFGSFNYTAPADKLNDENIIVVGNIDSTNTNTIKLQKQITTNCRNEINRIKKTFG